MSETPANEICWSTLKGEICIRAFCTPEEIRNYEFDKEFGTHAQYKSLYTKRSSLEEKANQADQELSADYADATDSHVVSVKSAESVDTLRYS